MQREYAQREKRDFGFEVQKHRGEKKNENNPSRRQGAVSNTGWESGDAQGATEAPRDTASKGKLVIE